MNETATRTTWWQRGLLMFGGMVFALILVTLILTLIPSWVPKAPSERQFAGVTMDVVFYEADGDLFAWLPGRVRPPSENVALAAYTLSWDEDGFRVPARVSDHYPIIAFGDSFTEAPNVASPWVDLVAQTLDVPIYNYGYRGYGPHEIAQVSREFAPRQAREWVLYAHFSGNDLVNADLPQEQWVQERTPLFLVPFLVARANEALAQPTSVVESASYDFPMPVIIADKYYELVLLGEYLWWQIAPSEGFGMTNAFRVMDETLANLSADVSVGTCKALIFVPTKEQLYYRYVHGDVRPYLRQLAQRPMILADGRMQLVPYAVSAEDEGMLMARFNDQRDALMALAAARGWYFIDLLPAFEEAVSRGELLYYRYDTHWNQAGHDLAARVIAEALRQSDCGISSDV